MSVRFKFGVVALVLAAMSSVAHASASLPAICAQYAPLDGNFDGRFYQVGPIPSAANADISWNGAKAAAEALPLRNNVQARLATINSLEEDQYVHCLVLKKAMALNKVGKAAWVGGFQVACTQNPGAGCGWQWLNGEPIAPSNTSMPYTNWQTTEPNDAGGDERHLTVNHGGNFGWNDERVVGNVFAYVAEFGDRRAAVPSTSCVATAPTELNPDGGCDLTAVLNVRYPELPNNVIEGDTTPLEFTVVDPDGRCGVEPLYLDLRPPFGAGVEFADVIVPPHLCAPSGRFKMYNVVAPETVITKGVVEFIADAEAQGARPCLKNNPYPNGLPTEQGVATYQTDNRADTLENDFLGNYAGTKFEGTLKEVSFDCVNPPRGGGRGSWYGVGLELNAGPLQIGADPVAHTQAFLIELQSYNLTLLQAAVIESKPALRKIDWLALRVVVDAAIFLHNRGHYAAALFKVRLFLALVERINYQVIAGENYNGEHLYRAMNIRDLYQRRWIPDLQ